MTGPIFHRVFLSVCPDTRLLESSSRFTSSAPRPGLSTSSSHIYKYQPAKWHFLSTHPLLGKNRELCDLAHRLTVLRHETSWGLAPPAPHPSVTLQRTAGQKNRSICHCLQIPKWSQFNWKSVNRASQNRVKHDKYRHTGSALGRLLD